MQTPAASPRPPPQRRFATLSSVRLALAETVRRIEREEIPPEQGRVLLDGYQALASIIRETRGKAP